MERVSVARGSKYKGYLYQLFTSFYHNPIAYTGTVTGRSYTLAVKLPPATMRPGHSGYL